jgi:hypothetical protein
MTGIAATGAPIFGSVQAFSISSTAAFSAITENPTAYLPFDTPASQCASGMWSSSTPTELLVQVAGGSKSSCFLAWGSGNSATATVQIRVNGNVSDVYGGIASLQREI